MLRKLLSVALTLTLVFMLAAPSAVALNTDIGSEIEIVGYNSSRLYTE